MIYFITVLFVFIILFLLFTMCFGNGFFFGKLMYVLEKIAAFMAMSAIISCITVTVMVSIGIGVGIGYNYCFVEQKIDRPPVIITTQPTTTPAISINTTQSTNTSEMTSTETKPPRRRLTAPITNLAAEPRGFANEPRLPDEYRSFLDLEYRRGEQSERSYAATEGQEEDKDSQQQIPNSNAVRGSTLWSPNFRGASRKIAAMNNKAGSASSIPRPGRRKTLQRFKPANPSTNWRRSQFDEIREGVKANAKFIDDSSKSEIENVYVTKGAEYFDTVRRTKYRRLKPIHRKQDEITKNITNTIVIPMKKYANISTLLTKILAENKNVTLHFITI